MNHVSFLTDFKSILDTVKVVLKREGATVEDGGGGVKLSVSRALRNWKPTLK